MWLLCRDRDLRLLRGRGSTRSRIVTNHGTGEIGVFELDATGQLHCLQCQVV